MLKENVRTHYFNFNFTSASEGTYTQDTRFPEDR